MKAIMTKAGTLFPYSEGLRKKYTYAPKFDDQELIHNYWVPDGKKFIWLPRNVNPIAEDDQRSWGQQVEYQDLFKPRNKEQLDVVEKAHNLLLNEESFIIQAPTGFGKTYVGATLIAKMGLTALVVVTKEDIKNQWVQALTDVLGLAKSDIAIIQGDRFNISHKPVALGMIQSMSKWDRYPSWVYAHHGLLMVDEVHRMGAEHFANLAWQHRGAVRIGLSATPKRVDGRDIVFRQHIGPVRVVAETLPMIPKVLYIKTGFMIPAVEHRPGRIGHIVRMMAGNNVRNARIASLAALVRNKGRNVVVFSDQLKHLDRISAMLKKEFDVPSVDIGKYVGGMTAAEREKAIYRPIVLATYAMASEATDVPWWDTCILGTPKSNVQQIVGRILRQYPDKKEPVVFDLVDGGSKIIMGYQRKRDRWYTSIGAKRLKIA